MFQLFCRFVALLLLLFFIALETNETEFSVIIIIIIIIIMAVVVVVVSRTRVMRQFVCVSVCGNVGSSLVYKL